MSIILSPMLPEISTHITCVLGKDLAPIVVSFIYREVLWWQISSFGFSVPTPYTWCDLSIVPAATVPLDFCDRWCDICCRALIPVAEIVDRSGCKFGACYHCNILVIAPTIVANMTAFSSICIYNSPHNLYSVTFELASRRVRRNLNPRRRIVHRKYIHKYGRSNRKR